MPSPYYRSYVAAKHGVVGLTASLRQELVERGLNDRIHVCTVLPAAFDTPWFDHAANFTGHDIHPKEAGDPAEVVDVIVRLATHPEDEVAVGKGAASRIVKHNVLPKTTEKQQAERVHENFMEGAPPAPETHGSLFTPSADPKAGGHPRVAHPSSLSAPAQTAPNSPLFATTCASARGSSAALFCPLSWLTRGPRERPSRVARAPRLIRTRAGSARCIPPGRPSMNNIANNAVRIVAAVSLTMLTSGTALGQAAGGAAGGAAAAVNTAMGFFITSVGKGDGGNLGGLAGADAHCQTLAAAAGAGNRTWAAYLSTQATATEPAVNAKDRIGTGPWYNQKAVLIATNPNTLHAPGNINKATALTEKGDMVNGRGDTPLQHDIMTGTQKDGTAFAAGTDRTCSNYTSNVAGAPGGMQLGHHDLQGAPTDNFWNFAHASTGCTQQNISQGGGAGFFYCFARQ